MGPPSKTGGEGTRGARAAADQVARVQEARPAPPRPPAVLAPPTRHDPLEAPVPVCRLVRATVVRGAGVTAPPRARARGRPWATTARHAPPSTPRIGARRGGEAPKRREADRQGDQRAAEDDAQAPLTATLQIADRLARHDARSRRKASRRARPRAARRGGEAAVEGNLQAAGRARRGPSVRGQERGLIARLLAEDTRALRRSRRSARAPRRSGWARSEGVDASRRRARV